VAFSGFRFLSAKSENMAYCPVIADARNGNDEIFGCTGPTADPVQDENEDLLCCSGDLGGTDYGGLFNCTAEYYGYMSNNTFSQNGTQMCIDGEESLTGITGRITPLCEDVA
jgi:hypothetical protein